MCASASVDRDGKSAHGRHDRGARWPRVLPPAARSAAGDQIVVGLRGIRVTPESKERDRLSFAFMSNGISSERQVETAVRQTAALVRTRWSKSKGGGGGRPGSGPYRRRRRAFGADSPRLRAGGAQRATRSACTMSKRRCSARRWACGWPTAARKSTATATTCAPSTRIYHAGSVRAGGGMRPAADRAFSMNA